MLFYIYAVTFHYIFTTYCNKSSDICLGFQKRLLPSVDLYPRPRLSGDPGHGILSFQKPRQSKSRITKLLNKNIKVYILYPFT